MAHHCNSISSRTRPVCFDVLAGGAWAGTRGPYPACIGVRWRVVACSGGTAAFGRSRFRLAHRTPCSGDVVPESLAEHGAPPSGAGLDSPCEAQNLIYYHVACCLIFLAALIPGQLPFGFSGPQCDFSSASTPPRV
jgi:hypothetical protein